MKHIQKNLRKYQILCWIGALERGWRSYGSIQPPSVSNVAAHMLDEDVYPGNTFDKFGEEYRTKLTSRQKNDAMGHVKRYLNRLCTTYRSQGLLKFLTPSDLSGEDDDLDYFSIDGMENILDIGGKNVTVQKKSDNFLDLKKGWASQNRFVRIYTLTNWGQKRIGLNFDSKIERPLDPTKQAPLDLYFESKCELVEHNNLDVSTDSVLFPDFDHKSMTNSGGYTTKMAVPRIEVYHYEYPEVYIREIDTNATHKIDRR